MAAYTRCLRCAGAPRRPASGSGLSLPFRPDMPSSLTPGSSDIACVQLRDADAAFAEIRAARHSQDSRNPFHAGLVFRGFTGSHLLRPVRLLAPLELGRIEARTGLRMMPTFPRSPRSFRTAGFPQYGWKAGLSGGAFPDVRGLSLLPACAC